MGPAWTYLCIPQGSPITSNATRLLQLKQETDKEPIPQKAEEQNARIADVVEREQQRLRNFIRKRVPDADEADDILQDVFYELVQAYRMMKPIERVTSWLFRVTRNRITDIFRKKRPSTFTEETREDDPSLGLDDLLPPNNAGPEAAYARRLLLEELDAALEELPEEQREVFIAHEFEGRSFKELSATTGVSVNTLLSRKHYAVLFLRKRLKEIYDEFSGT